MRKKFTVTQEDISNGEPGQCMSCPVAIACERGGLTEPSVWPDRVYYGKPEYAVVGGRTSVCVPRSVTRFIYRFDTKKTVKPFSFFLDIPETTNA